MSRRKDDSTTPVGSRRGLVVVALLASALLATVTGIVAAFVPGSTPVTAATVGIDSARAAYLDRDLPAAERILRGIIRDGSDDRAAKRLLARVLCDRGRLVEAKGTCDALLKDDSKDIEALRGLGQVMRAMGQPGIAIHWIQTAVELRKEDPTIWKDLGLAQRDAGDTLSAFTSLQKSLALDPDQADLSALLPDLLKAPSATEVPGLPSRINPHDPIAPSRPEDLLRNANRPRPPGYDPLMPSDTRPGLK